MGCWGCHVTDSSVVRYRKLFRSISKKVKDCIAIKMYRGSRLKNWPLQSLRGQCFPDFWISWTEKLTQVPSRNGGKENCHRAAFIFSSMNTRIRNQIFLLLFHERKVCFLITKN